MNVDEMKSFLAEQFPQGERFGELVELEPGQATMRLSQNDDHNRITPAHQRSTIMALADVAVYAALLSKIGPVSLAVTSNLNINFMKEPSKSQSILAQAKMLKVGKRLAVGEVLVFTTGDTDPIAHVTMTYAIPS